MPWHMQNIIIWLEGSPSSTMARVVLLLLRHAATFKIVTRSFSSVCSLFLPLLSSLHWDLRGG